MNNNCLERIQCPQCGNEGEFAIEAVVTATVVDDGIIEFSSEESWYDDSHIFCPTCHHEGTIGEFTPVGFYVTFETVTEESCELGEAERTGWWEAGEHLLEEKPIYPAFIFDDYDFDEDDHDSLSEAKVAWAVDLLRGEGACHPNTFPAANASWWGTEGNEVHDYSTGETIRKSFHFNGFTDDEIIAINQTLSAR